MRLKLYRAANVAGAMALVRAELGPEALILSTRRVADGVELTAALEPVPEPELLVDSPGGVAPEPAHSPCCTSGASDALLAYHGVPAAIALRLAGADLAGALARLLNFGVLPLAAPGATLLMAGAPGAGKTLSVARLATRLVLAGIQPTVITADGKRAGAAEELAAYTRLLGLQLMVASTPAGLAKAVGSVDHTGPVLIDTAGINPFAPGEVADLAELAAAVGATPILVMPAGQHPDEAADQVAAYAPLKIRHLLPTRLDLARRLGSIVAAAATGLILSEAGIGSGAADGLVPLTADMLAARLLAGRLPQSGGSATATARTGVTGGAGETRKSHRTPVFPSVRAQAAQAWNTEQAGDNGYRT